MLGPVGVVTGPPTMFNDQFFAAFLLPRIASMASVIASIHPSEGLRHSMNFVVRLASVTSKETGPTGWLVGLFFCGGLDRGWLVVR